MKIGILITVRTGSKRLESKPFLEHNGKPILSYLAKRLKNQIIGADIILCTTTEENDKVLVEFAKAYGLDWFRGDKENIVKRHLQCAESKDLDVIINVDGDDIFCNPKYINTISKRFSEGDKYDVIMSTGLPFGTNAFGYKKSVLETLVSQFEDDVVETGWGRLITDDTLFRVHRIPAEYREQLDVRLTLDYGEDFEMFCKVIDGVVWRDDIDQNELIGFLREHPEVANLNSHLNDIYWQNFEENIKKEGRENG